MCAILDANVAHEVFNKTTEAGREFLKWVMSGSGRLITGGKNRSELGERKGSIRQLVLAGKVRQEDSREIADVAQQLMQNGSCASDDEHIIALAQLSGARLLYSNDRLLQQDFNRKYLIDKPRGKVYSTQKTDEYDNSKFDEAKRRLLNRNLCRQA